MGSSEPPSILRTGVWDSDRFEVPAPDPRAGEGMWLGSGPRAPHVHWVPPCASVHSWCFRTMARKEGHAPPPARDALLQKIHCTPDERKPLINCLVAKSCPTLAAPWNVACQAPLSMEFSRQEHWSGLPFPSPGDLPDTGDQTKLDVFYQNTSSTNDPWPSILPVNLEQGPPLKSTATPPVCMHYDVKSEFPAARTMLLQEQLLLRPG